jgi:hypothetical protein
MLPEDAVHLAEKAFSQFNAVSLFLRTMHEIVREAQRR